MPKWPSLTRKTAWTIRQVIRRRHWNRALPIICGRPSAATLVSPCPRNTRYSGQCVSLRAGADCFPFLFLFCFLCGSIWLIWGVSTPPNWLPWKSAQCPWRSIYRRLCTRNVSESDEHVACRRCCNTRDVLRDDILWLRS